ncbi:hypothetical protein ACFSTI_04780 [Rhizorhabdus histidinilytica]
MTGPSKPPIGLPASLEGATREQRRVAELIASGPRGSVPSPFLAMLDAPLWRRRSRRSVRCCASPRSFPMPSAR